MGVAEQILRHLRSLPDSMQAQVLDFVEYLQWRRENGRDATEEADWSAFSLAEAMRGLQGEPSPYSADDIKEPFS